MDGVLQVAVPVIGIVAAAAVTFYAVSFNEVREKSLRELDDSENENGGGFEAYVSSRKRRQRRRENKDP